MGLSAWILGQSPNRQMLYPKLEMMVFLCAWKASLSNVRLDINCDWQHDNKVLACLGLRRQLQRYSQFAFKADDQPSKSVIILARKVNNPLNEEQIGEIADYFRFLSGQTDSQIRRLCFEAYPIRTSQAGIPFNIPERALAYKQSKRAKSPA